MCEAGNEQEDIESSNYDSIVTGFVGKLGNTVSAMCQNLEVAASDPEAKALINKIMEIQTELMLMKMEGSDPEDVEMVEGALISASQSLKASVSIDALRIAQKAWKTTLFETMSLILKLA